MLPFLCWTALAIVVNNSNLDQIADYVLHPDKTYWFLYVLFVNTALFFVKQRLSARLRINEEFTEILMAIVLVLLLLLWEIRILGFQLISFYYMFFILGCYLRKYHVTFSSAVVVLIGVSWLVVAVFGRMHEVPLPLKWVDFLPASLLIYIYRFSAAVLGSVFFLFLFKNFITQVNEHSIVVRFLAYLGKISLGIYVVHLGLGFLFGSEYRNIFSMSMNPFIIFLDGIIRLTFSIIVVEILKRIPYVSTLFLGKSFPKKGYYIIPHSSYTL